MKKISAEIVADSINPQGNRITTMLLTYPRFIHGELLTHRMFSKNSASSRAIPFEKMVEMVETDPFIPIAWQKDHKGMQGTEYIVEEDDIQQCIQVWLKARDYAIKQATSLGNAEGFTKVTKQLCNRLLEPFMWHTVLLTATEYENFFELRCPQYQFDDRLFRSKKDIHFYANDKRELDWLSINKGQAEIHIMALAEAMWDAMNESIPKTLQSGDWHIPFEYKINESEIDKQLGWLDLFPDFDELDQIPHKGNIDYDNWLSKAKIKISTAMAARTSYTVIGDEKEINYQKMVELHDTLLESQHMSPFEHCARAMSDEEYLTNIKGKIDADEYHLDNEDGFPNYVNPTGISIENSVSGWCRNFKGFFQYRHLIENAYENNNKFY